MQELQQEPQAQGLTGARGGSFTLPPHSALTSSCGRRLMRIRSAFSLSCLLSMRAKRSLEALSWQGEARAERSYALPVPRTSQWAEPPCTVGCHKSKPCTQEMNQPHAAPASDPPRPTAQPTDVPASQEPTQCCTHVATIPASGPAYLQLQDQVHPVLAEGADVVEDEGCDDVDPVGLVGHDAALGQQCSEVIPRVMSSLPASPPTQLRSKAVPCLHAEPSLLLQEPQIPPLPASGTTSITILFFASPYYLAKQELVTHTLSLCTTGNPCSPRCTLLHTLKSRAAPIPAAVPCIPQNPSLGIPDGKGHARTNPDLQRCARTWFSWQGPWQYSVRVSRVWVMRATLYSLM